MQALLDRRALFVRELAAHHQDPENIAMAGASLVPGLAAPALADFGLQPDAETAARNSPAMVVHIHAMLLRPRTLKSPLDEQIQNRLDDAAEPILAERRKTEHKMQMRMSGSSIATAKPRAVESGSDQR
jgi:hypothetical protein